MCTQISIYLAAGERAIALYQFPGSRSAANRSPRAQEPEAGTLHDIIHTTRQAAGSWTLATHTIARALTA